MLYVKRSVSSFYTLLMRLLPTAVRCGKVDSFLFANKENTKENKLRAETKTKCNGVNLRKTRASQERKLHGHFTYPHRAHEDF